MSPAGPTGRDSAAILAASHTVAGRTHAVVAALKTRAILPSRALRSVPDHVLARSRRIPPEDDQAEIDEIDGELADAINTNLELGDVAWRLDEWRRAERAYGANLDEAVATRGVLRASADDASDAFHAAEGLQRRRHGCAR